MNDLFKTLLTRLSKLEANPQLINKTQNNQTFYALTAQSAEEYFDSFGSEDFGTPKYICHTEAVHRRISALMRYL